MGKEFEWGNPGRLSCSYKRTTVIICFINLVASVYVIYSLLTSFYIVSLPSFSSFRDGYTEDQIRIMEESIRIRQASEPTELLKLVKAMKKKIQKEESVSYLPRRLKQDIADEILIKLRSYRIKLKGSSNFNVTEQRDVAGCSSNKGSLPVKLEKRVHQETLEIWRKTKLEETKKMLLDAQRNSSKVSPLVKEAGMLTRALDSDWNVLLEDIGLWIPPEILNKEDAGKPKMDQELEEQIIPGRPIPPECHAEKHTDYDGAAVRWGLTHHKESVADCCQACLDQAKIAKPGEMKCNIWVYCPSEAGCYSPDVYEHKHQECWLKHSDHPRLNFKDKYSEAYRNAHPTAPVVVPWMSGVISA